MNKKEKRIWIYWSGQSVLVAVFLFLGVALFKGATDGPNVEIVTSAEAHRIAEADFLNGGKCPEKKVEEALYLALEKKWFKYSSLIVDQCAPQLSGLPLLVSLFGANMVLNSSVQKTSSQKVQLLNLGLEQLKRAVTMDPNSWRVRLLRIQTLSNIPWFFRDSRTLRNDQSWIKDVIKKSSPDEAKEICKMAGERICGGSYEN